MLLYSSVRGPAAADRSEREEGVIDTLVRHVQPGLKRVQKFVQAARDNLLDVRVRQFCAQLTERCSVAKAATSAR